ncbi:epimerase [Mycobacterium sp. MS1601]|uniref:NAD-dependent epimerase/dehydratase family protein n=1 Tax=Mycobacterium sp. MS1601 TaxID=1936029 RepID=UPI0009794B34|nr:NAD-dependent epimerase/dehydratase family protein [Mycobacterium sp. MS1601]AQA04252.1 epimerase [Mycobacterium sp. MS1601]
MKVFITGGSGFVGLRAIRRLVDEGHDVSALARSPRAERLVASAGATPVPGDLVDLGGHAEPSWLRALRAVDAVVHSAAFMEFWGPDELFRQRNHEPSVALHAAAARAGVRKFVLISAASVATGSQRASTVSEATDEGRPNIAYSRVKLATERALLHTATPGMSTIALRPPFVWGAGMPTISQFADAVSTGRFAWIDQGRHIMDTVHVDNLVEAISCALKQGRAGASYYVTDGAPLAVRDFFVPLLATEGVDVSGARSFPRALAYPIGAVMDAGARLLRRRQPPALTNWMTSFMGRDRSYDITAARRELGYAPVTSHAEGLAEMSALHEAGQGHR